jgi:hypothetical protein
MWILSQHLLLFCVIPQSALQTRPVPVVHNRITINKIKWNLYLNSYRDAESIPESGLNKWPTAGIPRLLLGPNKGLNWGIKDMLKGGNQKQKPFIWENIKILCPTK